MFNSQEVNDYIRENHDYLLGWQRKAVVNYFRNKTSYVFTPRQNGKSQVLVVIADILYKNGMRVLVSAHRTYATRDLFLKIQSAICVSKSTDKVLTQTGREEIRSLKHKGRIMFISRSRANGVGLTCDACLLDEGQFIESEHMLAMMPTMITSDFQKTLITGTAPARNDPALWIREKYKSRVRKEWTLYSVSNKDSAMSEVFTKKVNPSLGKLITKEALSQSMITMSEQDILSEHCCHWDSDTDLRLFNQYKVWEKGGKIKELSIGIKISIDGKLYICCSGKIEDNLIGHFLFKGDIDYGIMQLTNFIKGRNIKMIAADVPVAAQVAAVKRCKVITSAEFFNRIEKFRAKVANGEIYIDNQIELVSAMSNAAQRLSKNGVPFGISSIDINVDTNVLEALAVSLGAEYTQQAYTAEENQIAFFG